MPIFKSLFVAFLMVYASGCGCTLAGCEDGVAFELKRTSGDWEPGKYTFAVDADGAKSNCTVDIPIVADPTCTAGLQLDFFSEATDASSGTSGVRSVLLFGAPTQVTLTVSRDAVELAKKTSTPTYTKFEPNGEICGPTCHGATEALTIP